MTRKRRQMVRQVRQMVKNNCKKAMMMKNRIRLLTTAVVLALGCPAATVETDRTWYLAGEAMTVSVTDDDALIAYAELCDTHGLVAGTAISLDRGVGKGVIELPADMHSGYYVLSAYSRHDTSVSNHLVAVVNTLRKSEDDDVTWVAADSCWATADGAAELTSSKDVDIRETEGHIVRARVKNVYNGNTFSSSQILPSVSIVGKQIHYFDGQMVNDTTAVFYTYDIHGRQPLVLTAVSYTGESLPVEMISPFSTLLPKSLPHLVFHYKRSEVETRSIGMQRHQKAITRAERDDTDQRDLPQGYEATAFGTQPDLSYNLDEYRQFLKVSEVLLEYVRCVKKTRINGVQQLVVRRTEDPFNTLLPSLVLIDGMPVVDTERLLDYDARRIHYINIYDRLYTLGHGVYNGILSFITRSGRLTNYPTERNVQYLVYEFP